jgi:transposase
MGLSRRMVTKEFKLAAVQLLERGNSIGEVARALEVNPNVLHRWRREVRQGPGNVFPGHGKQRWAEGRIAELERKIGRCTRPSATCRPPSSNETNWMPLRGSFLYEFSKASGNLSIRSGRRLCGQRPCSSSG